MECSATGEMGVRISDTSLAPPAFEDRAWDGKQHVPLCCVQRGVKLQKQGLRWLYLLRGSLLLVRDCSKRAVTL